MPVDRAFEQDGLGATYRKLYEQKLLVTSGDVARYVFLPGLKGEEKSVSVYRAASKKGGMPGDYWVTATKSSGTLWSCVPETEDPVDDLRTIRIQRRDAPLPESTALAIHKLWLAKLAGTRPPPGNEIQGDSDTMIFSATNSAGVVLRAEAHDLQKNNLALIGPGETLVEYCTMSASVRTQVARKIEKWALRLAKAAR
jgi:hypothetical protein